MAIFKNKTLLAPGNSDIIGYLRSVVSDMLSKILSTSSTDSEIPTAKAVVDLSTPTTKYNNDAFTYASSTAGLSGIGEYDSNVPRRVVKFGKMVLLTFQCKATSVANSANWTYIGTVANGYRPVRETPIVAQVYNNGTNEAAGGSILTNGQVKIWTNSKVAGNNWQMRVSAVYESTWD